MHICLRPLFSPHCSYVKQPNSPIVIENNSKTTISCEIPISENMSLITLGYKLNSPNTFLVEY